MRSSKAWLKGVLSCVGLSTALWSTPVDAESRFRTYGGGLTTEQVPCATLCTAGPLTGGLAGTLEFTMASMTETNIPDVVTYTGVNDITTASGTLSGTDYGIWNLATGEFVDYMTFSSGTGEYAGAQGTLVIVGRFDPVTGVGSSRYTAVVFTP